VIRRGLSARLALILTIATLAAMFSLFAAPAQATGGAFKCAVRVHNPHYSTGAGGAIVKGDWRCPNTSAFGFDLKLWRCGSQSLSETRCVLEGRNKSSMTAAAGVLYTRYAPAAGYPGAHGAGWWIGQLKYYHPSNAGRYMEKRGSWVYLNV
jgi:hypothetical protein